jgi:hypothetical protein
MKIKEKSRITDGEIKCMWWTAMCIWRDYNIIWIKLGPKSALTKTVSKSTMKEWRQTDSLN